jgi:oligopeptide/dipeptide ABC transporter ATP-binding protein
MDTLPSAPLIAAEGLSKKFAVKQGGVLSRRKLELWAVDDVNFAIGQGETLGLVGESGCGKTTTAMMLLRLEKPSAGAIRYRGEDIFAMDGAKVHAYRAAVQAVLQDPWSSLSPRMTVGSIVGEPLKVHSKLSRAAREERVAQLLEDVGLHAWQMSLYPHEFSGGQRQRICLARALSLEPQLIVLDEPVSALDVSVQAQIMNLLKEIQERRRIGYLLISHNLGTVRYLCSHIAVMYLGQIVETAPSRVVLDNPLHPYTRALIAASRIVTDDTEDAAIKDDDIPSPTDRPPGCRFYNRCPSAMARCQSVMPELREIEPGHHVRCHLYDDRRSLS